MAVALIVFGLAIAVDYFIVGMLMTAVGILLIVNGVNIRLSDIAGLAVMLLLVYLLFAFAEALQSSGY
jgi:hypothetical protein